MTNNQLVFKEFLEKQMSIHENDMIRALTGANKYSTYEVRQAVSRLSIQERNQVICEILLPF